MARNVAKAKASQNQLPGLNLYIENKAHMAFVSCSFSSTYLLFCLTKPSATPFSYRHWPWRRIFLERARRPRRHFVSPWGERPLRQAQYDRLLRSFFSCWKIKSVTTVRRTHYVLVASTSSSLRPKLVHIKEKRVFDVNQGLCSGGTNSVRLAAGNHRLYRTWVLQGRGFWNSHREFSVS